MGKSAHTGGVEEEGSDAQQDEDAVEASMTMAAKSTGMPTNTGTAT